MAIKQVGNFEHASPANPRFEGSAAKYRFARRPFDTGDYGGNDMSTRPIIADRYAPTIWRKGDLAGAPFGFGGIDAFEPAE